MRGNDCSLLPTLCARLLAWFGTQLEKAPTINVLWCGEPLQHKLCSQGDIEAALCIADAMMRRLRPMLPTLLPAICREGEAVEAPMVPRNTAMANGSRSMDSKYARRATWPQRPRRKSSAGRRGQTVIHHDGCRTCRGKTPKTPCYEGQAKSDNDHLSLEQLRNAETHVRSRHANGHWACRLDWATHPRTHTWV